MINAAEKSQGINIVVDIDPTDVVVGDTISISYGTSPNLTVQSVVITQEMLDTAPPQATFSVPDELIIHGQVLQGSVTISDQFGNISTPQNFSQNVDTLAPGATGPQTVPVINIPEALDGISAEDAKDGIQIEVTPTSDSVPGDRIEVTVKSDIDDSTILEILVIPANWDGISPIIVTIPTSKLPDNGTHKVTAVIKDGSNNASGSSEEFSIDVNTDSVRPTVYIAEAKDGINKTEISDGIQIEINPPTDAIAGHRIVVTISPGNGTGTIEQALEIPQDWDGKSPLQIIIPSNNLPTDGQQTVSVKVVDSDDNTIGETSVDEVILIDTVAPGEGTVRPAPTFNIPEAEDGNVSAEDVKDGIQVTLTPPLETNIDDVIIFNLTPADGSPIVTIEIDIPDDWDGASPIAVTIPANSLPNDGSYSVTTAVKDPSGNVSQVSDAQDLNLNTESNQPTVFIEESENGINKNELADGLQISINPPTDAAVGNVISVVITPTEPGVDPIIVSAVIPEGWNERDHITITIPTTQTIPDGQHNVVVTVRNPDNSIVGAPSNPESILVDTIAPGEGETTSAPTIEIDSAVDGITADEVLNGLTVSVTPPTGTSPGDIVTILFSPTAPGSNPIEITLEIPANWVAGQPIDVNIESNQLPDDGDYNVTTSVTDQAGNTSETSTPLPITILANSPVVIIPEIENGINAKEAEDGIQLVITPPRTAKAGDLITVTLVNDGIEGAATPIIIPSNWDGITPIEITISPDKITTDGSHVIQVTVSDSSNNPVGNPTNSPTFIIDTNAPGSNGSPSTPLIDVPEAAGNVDAEELKDGITVLITIPSDSEAGDTIKLSLSPGPNNEPLIIEQEVPSDWDGTSQIELVVPFQSNLPDGEYQLTAIITDKAGNSGATSPTTAININTDSSQPTVFIPEAENGINAVEAADGIQIFVNPPNSATPGSILTTTFDNGVDAPQTFQSFIPNDWNGVDQVELVIASAEIPNDGTYNVTVAASLPFFGQLGESSIPQSVTIDTSAPGTSGSPSVPIIDIPEAVDGINIDEFIDGIQINATLPSDVVPGDTVVITISHSNGTPVSFEIEVPSSWQPAELLPLTIPPELFNSDGTYSITATVKDQVGNISQPSITQDIELNISTNKPVVSIPEAEGGINKEEAIDGIEVIIIPPEGTKVGDTIKVTMRAEGSDTPIIIDIPVPSSWNGFGPINYSIDSDDTPTDGTYTVTTIVVDENLQQIGEVSESQNITIDTLAPGDVGDNPTPIIEIAEATDGIDAEESKDGIQVLIYPPSGTLGGDTITVTLTSSSGTPVVTSYVIPDDWNGSDPISVTIPPEELPADGQYDISANVTDKVGNTSSDSPSVTIQLDTASTKPTVYVKEAENGINAAEVEDGIQIQIKLPTGTEPGDLISVSITSLDGSVEANHLFTVPDGWTPQERLNVTFPTDKVPEDGSYEVTASVSKIGQSEQGELSEKESISIDTTAPGSEGPVTKPIISTPEVTGPFVNESMLTDGLQVVVQPPSGSIPGDLIEVNVYDSNNEFIISVINQIPVDWEDPQTITVNVNKEILTPDGLYSINTIVRDASGNPSLASDNIALNVDSTAPGEGEEISRPILVAAESENGINKQELSDDIQTELTLPDGTSIGDTIVFTISAADDSVASIEIPVTAEHFNNDELIRPFPIEIPQSYFTSEQTYTVSVHVKDPAGNPSIESEKVNLNVDTIAPGENTENTSPQHEIAEAVDGVNAQEMLNGVQISVKVPIGTLPGDTINVLIQNESIGEDTYAFIIPLNWVPTDNVDFTIPNSFYPVDGEYNITSSVSDLAGNISESSTTSLITVDTTPPGNGLKPKLAIPESEGTINKQESIDGIDIIVTPPAGTLPGDSVTVAITGEGIEPQITLDYIIPENWVEPDEIPYVIPTTVLPGDGEYKVIVSITDPSGNTSEPSSPVNIELNTTVPGEEKQPSPPTLDVVDGDNGVNSQEFTDASGVAIAIGLPSDSQVGDIITLTITDSSDNEHTLTHTVTAQNITDNSALVTVTQLTGVNITDGQYDISAVVTRGTQESEPSNTAEFTLDRAAPGQGTGAGDADDPVLISVPEQVDGGNIDATEASDGILVNVTPPIGTELGDTITLTLTDVDGKDVLVEHTIQAPWAQGGVVAVTIPVSAISDGGKFVDGDYTISATVTDQQGNESAPSDDTGITLATDTDGGNGAVTPPIISMPAADDGLINKTELDGLTLTITPPADAQPNDVINVTLTPATGPAVVVPVTIPSTWVAGDTINQLITGLNHGDKITVTATITKDGVDSTSTPIDFTVDTQPPGTGTGEGGSDAAPGVTIPEATDNVTLEEANDGVDVLVTPPTDSLPGDTITLTVTQPGGAVVTVEQVIDATWDGASPITVTIPVSDISVDGAFNDGQYAVSATITDEAGNTSLAGTENFTLDTAIDVPPAISIKGVDAANGDTIIDAEEIQNTGGEKVITVSVSLPDGTEVGDTIRLFVSTEIDPQGFIDKTIPLGTDLGQPFTIEVDAPEDGDYSIAAQIIDTAGQTSSKSIDTEFTIDTEAHTIILEGPGVDVVEGQATGEYTITLSKEIPAGESVTVFLEYSGTADNGDDFTGITSVEIGAGQTSVQFNLQTIDDAALEENETLTVTLKNVVDTNNATGTAGFTTLPVIDRNQDQATINITPDPAPVDENDIPEISVEGPDEVREGEEAVFTFKISDEPSELFDPNLVPVFGEVAVAIIVEVSGVDTISGQNVTEEIRLFFNVGQSEITYSVTSIADSLKEDPENITVSIKEIFNNIPSRNPNWNFGGFESAPIISPTNGTATTRVIDQQFEILDAIDLSESNDFSSTAIRGNGGTVGQLVELLDQNDLVIGSGFVKADGTWEVEVNSSVTTNAVHTIKAQLFESALDSSSVINTTDEISYLKSNSEETTAQITSDNAVEREFIFTGLSDDSIVVSIDNPNSLKVDGGDGTDTLVLDAYDTDFIAGQDDDGNVTLTYRKDTNKVITLIDIEKVAFVDNTVDVNDLRDTRIVIRDGDGILKSTDLSHKIYIGGQLAEGHTPEDIVLVGTVGGRSIVHTISKDNITVTDDGMFFVDVDNLGAITFDGEDVGFNDATQLIAFMETRDADGLIHNSVQDESIIHTKPPEAVAKITEITEDDGLFGDDFITTDNQLTISGTISKALLEDETLQIFVNNEWITIESSSLVSIDGTDMFAWSYVDNRSLPDGEYEYRAQVIDDLGLSSSTSRQVVIVDQNNTHNSGAQVSFTNVLADTGVSDSDYITNYDQYLIKGEVSTKLQDDEKVQILVGTEWVDLTIQSTISPDIPTVYNWFYRVDEPLDNGVYDYQARIVSAAGHIVGDVVSQSITVDKTLTDTEISIESLGVDPITGNEQDTGLSNSDFRTNVNSDIILIGQLTKPLASDEFLEIQILGEWITIDSANITTGADGIVTWTYTDTRQNLADRQHTYALRVGDIAGNVTETYSKNIYIDTNSTATNASTGAKIGRAHV